MKKTDFILSIIFTGVFISHGQSQVPQPLSQARGHYQQLLSFAVGPKSPNEAIDQKKFVTDQPTIERRLSLKPIYLQEVSVEDFKIPDPPANSSAQTRAEIDYLLKLQYYRNAEDVRSSLYMANVYYNLRVKPTDTTYARYRRNLFQIGRSIGSWFNPETLPVTAEVLAKVWQDASFFIWSLKFKYARIRPCVVDPAVKNLEVTDWAAYPSGHAANSYINAFIYQELAPVFTDFFVKDAFDMAHSREIIGVHYPSDSEASRIFARQFVNKLWASLKTPS